MFGFIERLVGKFLWVLIILTLLSIIFPYLLVVIVGAAFLRLLWKGLR